MHLETETTSLVRGRVCINGVFSCWLLGLAGMLSEHIPDNVTKQSGRTVTDKRFIQLTLFGQSPCKGHET